MLCHSHTFCLSVKQTCLWAMALPEEKVDKDGCWSSKVDESYLLWLRFIGKWGLFQAFFWQLWPLWPLQQPLFMFILLSLSSSWSSLRGFITSPARAKTPHDCRSSSRVPVIIPNRPKRGGQVGGRLNPGWPVSPRGSLNHWARDKNEDTWRLSSWQHYRQLFLNEYSSWQKEWQNIWKLEFCTYALNDSDLMMKNSFMTQ